MTKGGRRGVRDEQRCEAIMKVGARGPEEWPEVRSGPKLPRATWVCHSHRTGFRDAKSGLVGNVGPASDAIQDK